MNILGIGTIMTDIYLKVPKLADYGGEESINFIERKVGGSVVNTTLILNQLGLNPTLVASVGKDIAGSAACTYLKNLNIDIIPSLSEVTASAYIVQDGKDSTMYSYSPFTQLVIPDIPTPDVFYTSCYELHYINAFRDILNVCNMAFLDLSPLLKQVPLSILKESLSAFSVITGNIKEFRELLQLTETNSVQELIRCYGFKKAYIKQGDYGSSVYTKDHYYSAPVPPATNAIGCGDAYNAGIIYGEINHHDLQTTLNMGNYLGRNVAHYGFDPQLVILGFAKKSKAM